MAQTAPHMPRACAIFTPRVDWVAFPAPNAVPDLHLGHLIDAMDVRDVTVIAYDCTGRWSMPERRIGDDMFFHILSGRGEAEVEGRCFPLRAGVSAHFRRGRRHRASTDPSDPLRVVAIHYSAMFCPGVTLAETAGFPDWFPCPEGPLAWQAACREFALQPPGWRRSLEAWMLRLLCDIMRDHAARLIPSGDGAQRSADHRRLLPALEAMGRNLARPMGIPELSALCHLSPAQFRRLCARVLGHPPLAHLQRLRMEEACRQLRQGDQPIRAIAAAVGYADPGFFAGAFRRIVGMPPGAYRAGTLHHL